MVDMKCMRLKGWVCGSICGFVFILITFVILFSSQSVYGVTQVEQFGNWGMYVETTYDTYPVFNTFLFSVTSFTIKGKTSEQQLVGMIIGINQYHNKMYFAFQFVKPIGLTINDPNVRVVDVYGEETYAVRLTNVRFFDMLQNQNNKNKNMSNVKIYVDVYAIFNPELYNTAYIIMDDKFLTELLTHKYCEITITVNNNFINFVIDTYGLKEGVSQLIKVYSYYMGSL